jgi:hypothetical protein
MARETDAPSQGARDEAERRFAELLQETGAPDPRERYREWLRRLRSLDESDFRKELDHYENQLVPAVARSDSDPLAEWTEYGLRLAQRLVPGAPVRIDASGRSRPCDLPAPLDDLVLHLPTAARELALAVRLPPQLSPAQQAAFELLVEHSLG